MKSEGKETKEYYLANYHRGLSTDAIDSQILSGVEIENPAFFVLYAL